MKKLLTAKKNRNFQKLWWAQLISQIGDRFNQMALVGLVAERSPGSTMDLAFLLMFTIIPVFFFQPIAGVVADRFSRRMTLIISDMARCLLVLSIPWVFYYQDTLLPIYVVVFLIFTFSRFHLPAKMSIIPDLVEEEDLLKANSLMTTSGMIAFIIGVTAGGFVIEFLGARDGFIVDGMTYFISGMLVLSMAADYNLNQVLVKPTYKDVSAWTDIKEGFVYLKDHTELRALINMIFFLFSSIGAIYVVIIVYIQKTFNSVVIDLAFLGIPMGLGLLLGTLAYGKWGKEIKWYRSIFFCLIFGGVMLVTFTAVTHFYPVKWVGMILAFILGIVIGPIIITANTVIHLVSDENMRGRVFSALEIVIHLAFLLAMLASSWASRKVDEAWILLVVGTLVAILGLWGFAQKDKFVTKST